MFDMEEKSEKSHYDVQVEIQSKDERDAVTLARLGKKSVLKRRYGFFSMLGFTCTILVTWEGSLVVFTLGLTNGGSAGLIYGYLLVWAGVLAIFTTMAELASMAPTSGGQYHWAYMLAPVRIRKFTSYIIGWLVIAAWQALLAGCAFLGANMIVAVISMNDSSFTPQQWHGTLLMWALTVMGVSLNVFANALIPKFEMAILVLHISGFLAVLVPLLALAPAKASAHDVFTDFLNGGAWPTDGTSFFVGIVGSVYAMFGCDCAVHMAEEVQNAEVVVPWSMVLTTILNGAFGFAMVVAVLFVTVDIEAALASTTGSLGYPFMDIFLTATGSHAGASVMIAIIITIIISATVAFVATTSRLIWAFARDRGFPGWRHVSKVQPTSTVPLHAVIITLGLSILIGLINLGSSAAFNDVLSLSISALFASYVITESLLLYRRVTGGVRFRVEEDQNSTEANQLIWGPFHVPGIFGVLVNIFAILFGTVVFFFSFWPVATPVTPATMNFSILMTGAVTIFAVVYYVIWARHTYQGPLTEEM